MGSDRPIDPTPMTWPRKVFLESTALFRLGPELENVEFARLLQLRDHLQFELKVAEEAGANTSGAGKKRFAIAWPEFGNAKRTWPNTSRQPTNSNRPSRRLWRIF